MDSRRVHNRQMAALSHVARLGCYRTDTLVGLRAIDPALVEEYGATESIARLKEYAPGERSEMLYDLQELQGLGLLEFDWLDVEGVDEYGQHFGADPAVGVTFAGLAKLQDWDRSWLARAIDKQPMTFVTALLATVTAILTGLNLWLVLWKE